MFSSYYDDFKKIFANKDEKYRNIKIDGESYFIYVNFSCCKFKLKEPDLFWHISSIGSDELTEIDGQKKYKDFYPCVNTEFLNRCIYDCKSSNNSFLAANNRFPCVFRSSCINKIPQILTGYINNDYMITSWTKENRFFIRSNTGAIDYVLIFEKKEKSKVLVLITAFPVVLNSYKRKFDEESKNMVKV